jgi:hypothetical protein
MAEIIDLNKIKAEREKQDPSTRPKTREWTDETYVWLAKIHAEKMDALIRMMRSNQGISQTTAADSDELFSGMAEQDIINYINDASVVDINRKPTLFTTAFGKLVKPREEEE